MKKLNIEAIRIDGDTQAREALSQEKVNEYAELMKDGAVFPPIDVFFDGSEYWLADGFHRYFATKANKTVSIEANVVTGTLEEAQLYACGANKGRGLEMSWKDIRHVVMRMLRHGTWGKWTNAEIARHVGCSKMTVGRVKASIEVVQETKKTYRNQHGQEKTIQTKNLGRKKEEVVDEDHRVVELTDTVNDLSIENQTLRDKIAIGQWDASEIEKIDVQDTVDGLREQIRILEIDNKALRDSRDMFQNRNAELMRTVKALQNKLK